MVCGRLMVCGCLKVFHKIITTGHQRLQPLFDCLLTIVVNGNQSLAAVLLLYTFSQQYSVWMCGIDYLFRLSFGSVFKKNSDSFKNEFGHFLFELQIAQSYSRKTIWMDVKFLDGSVLKKRIQTDFWFFPTPLVIYLSFSSFQCLDHPERCEQSINNCSVFVKRWIMFLPVQTREATQPKSDSSASCDLTVEILWHNRYSNVPGLVQKFIRRFLRSLAEGIFVIWRRVTVFVACVCWNWSLLSSWNCFILDGWQHWDHAVEFAKWQHHAMRCGPRFAASGCSCC